MTAHEYREQGPEIARVGCGCLSVFALLLFFVALFSACGFCFSPRRG